MKRFSSSLVPAALNKWRVVSLALGVVVFALPTPGFAQNETPSVPAVQPTAGATNGEARQFIQETGQAAVNKIQVLWQKIDERRLKNRTADQIVAWVIMGSLVGGLLYRFGKRGQVTSIVLGLVGAFIGGIVANVSQLSLGLGPVLITYEDLLFTLLGGVLIICGARWSSILKLFKGPIK